MRQITVELEKDWKHCPKRLMDEFAKEEREWISKQKKGKRYNWTKRKPRVIECEECGKDIGVWDEYGQRHGVCDQTCYMHLVGMSWSDFY
ncbi:hypothetical protein P9Z80_27090 [Bacillus cereus]|nr:hypothetical protein [Bacillus cereus]MEC3260287.1 hypothetical protein [Bacillus cereus]